jgi:N-methylhydantoinase B
VLPAKVTLEITKDTVLRHEQAGGGGFGDPRLRNPDAIRADLWNGKISLDHARKNYGFEEE